MLLMSSVGALIVLLLISSVPAIAAYVWFRFARYPFSLLRFSLSLLTGAASFFPALLMQNFFATQNGIFFSAGKWGLFADIFARIALTEELSRLIMLILLFLIIRRITLIGQMEESLSVSAETKPSGETMASATGLVAGLGFALIESAVYGASNPFNPLLRAFTAAPLHGACGFRIGSAIALFRTSPIRAFFRFLSAVIIHGAYNFMFFIPIPGFFPLIVAILIAFFALFSAILAIRSGMKIPPE